MHYLVLARTVCPRPPPPLILGTTDIPKMEAIQRRDARWLHVYTSIVNGMLKDLNLRPMGQRQVLVYSRKEQTIS